MLQHRGQDSAGMVTLEGQKFIEHKANGLVKDVFNNQKTLDKLKGVAPATCRLPFYCCSLVHAAYLSCSTSTAWPQH